MCVEGWRHFALPFVRLETTHTDYRRREICIQGQRLNYRFRYVFDFSGAEAEMDSWDFRT